MAILEWEMVSNEQLFFPYIETQNGKTLFQVYVERKGNLITDGKKDE